MVCCAVFESLQLLRATSLSAARESCTLDKNNMHSKRVQPAAAASELGVGVCHGQLLTNKLTAAELTSSVDQRAGEFSGIPLQHNAFSWCLHLHSRTRIPMVREHFPSAFQPASLPALQQHYCCRLVKSRPFLPSTTHFRLSVPYHYM